VASRVLKNRLERQARGLAPEAQLGPGGKSGAPGSGTNLARGPAAFALALLIAAALLAALWLSKVALRRFRYRTDDPRATAAACRRELIGFLADQGIPVPRSAGPRELSRLLRDAFGVNGEAFATALAEARYGPPQHAAAAAETARRELRQLRSTLRLRLEPRRRVRGFVSLRSLTA
jgi:hypothetical protein